MFALALSLLLAQAAPAPVEAAVRAAAVGGARVEVRSFKVGGKPCAAVRADVRPAVKSSGAVPVRVQGDGCEAWGWAQVALFVPVQKVTAAAKEGARIESSTEERELTPGRTYVAALPDGAVASRPLAIGTLLEPQHLRSAGPSIGAEVTVVASSGALQIAQRGRVIGCSGSKGCAQLANGRRVEGTFENGRLLVELQ